MSALALSMYDEGDDDQGRPEADPKSQKKGRPFGIRGYQMFRNFVKGVPRNIVVREAVQNSAEAGATQVQIWVDSDGTLCIADNGRGMSAAELEDLMSDLEASGKKVGLHGNLGVGLKLAVMTINLTLRITSRPAGAATSRQAWTVELGPMPGGDYGMHFLDGDKVIKESRFPARADYNTLIEIQGMDVTPDEVLAYLNQRYLRMPVSVSVKLGAEKDVWQAATGSLACMKAICQSTGTEQYPNCLLHWGILSTTKKGEIEPGLVSTIWPAPSISLAYKGETYRETSRKYSDRLGKYGVWVGGQYILFIIEAQGDDLSWQGHRSAINGWSEDLAQEDIRDALPKPVKAFLDVFRVQHTDDHAALHINVRDKFAQIAAELAMPSGTRMPRDESPQSEDEEQPEETGADKPQKGSPTTRRRSGTGGKPRKPRGMPEFHFGDSEAVGTRAIKYDETSNKFIINKEWPRTVKALSLARTERELQDIKEEICLGVLVGVAVYQAQYDAMPPQNVLEMAMFSNISPYRALRRNR